MFYRYDAPLFFANIGDLRERVHKLLAIENQAYPDSPVRWFVLNVEANIEIDITAADGLRELARELADQRHPPGPGSREERPVRALDRAGVIDAIGKDMLFATLPVAEESYLRWALAHEPAQPAETPAEVVDDEPARQPAALASARPGRRAGGRARPRPRPLTTVLVAASPSFIGRIRLRSAAVRSRETGTRTRSVRECADRPK